MPTYLKVRSPVEGWRRVINKIMERGMLLVGERGSKTRWLHNVVIHIADPYSNRVDVKYPFSERVLKEKYATQLLNPDRMDFDYTYGERLNAWGPEGINQIEYVINKLRATPNSRRAVATAWDPRKDPLVDEVPCLNHFVFMVRENHLDLSVMIRSNDMYGAWLANVYALGELLSHVAQRVNLPPGTITTMSVNAHIYEHDWEKAREV
ncbi:MAG: thymidylate synthase [Candidatus Thorarchaeota archaeon]|nr:MAG: thymidylate synthase [Candidatus Thorarchaeota archaeon]RLI57303.1 MAG: thymidylate synthase [Candidatus Thorarchaeota archaeon]